MKVRNLVMVMSGRSGSSYLMKLMNQDDRIYVIGEPLVRRSVEFEKSFLEEFYSGKISDKPKTEGREVLGLKTKFRDIGDRNNFILQLKEKEPIIIVNRRRNYVKQAISRERMDILAKNTAEKYGKPDYSPRRREDIVGKLHHDVESLNKWIKEFERRDLELEEFTNSMGNSVATIFYEDFLSCPEFAISKLSSLLGFDLQVRNTTFTFKNTPVNLREAVSNYDELEKSLESTKYHEMLYSP